MTARVEFFQSNDNYLGNFNRTVNYLLPACPVKNVKTRNEKGNNNKSSNISSLNLKSGTGKTGVELRWYPKPEWLKLTDAQREECIKWSKTELGKVAFRQQRKAWNNKKKQERDRKRKREEGDNNGDSNNIDRSVRAALGKEVNYEASLAEVYGDSIKEVCKEMASNSNASDKAANINKMSGKTLKDLVNLRPGKTKE